MNSVTKERSNSNSNYLQGHYVNHENQQTVLSHLPREFDRFRPGLVGLHGVL